MPVFPAVRTRIAPITIVRACSLLLVLACLAACSSQRPTPSTGQTSSRGAYKVGNPYTIDGVSYTPVEEFNRVETGVASWYGPGFHSRPTANGERYDQEDRTAAHRTLQMPSIVRVTNLDNGRSTVVRINDRGPYARNRVIDLSRTAAQELDMIRTGTARVRIEQLPAESRLVKDVALGGGGPAEQNEAVARLASGRPAPAPAAQPAVATAPVVTAEPARPTIASLAGTAPAPAAVPSPSGGFYVQTGAFSTVDSAERQRGLVRSYGASEIFQASAAGRDVYRVRLGPYTTPDAAGIVADRLKRSGYGDARVVSD